MNYVDKNGLSRFLTKIKSLLANKVDKVSGKGLSTNDYTTAEKNKLAGLSNYSLPTASSSVLGGVKVGSNLSILSGVLSANVPTKVSQLTNDSGYQTASQVNSAITSKGYITSIPSEYITETELNAKGYQTASQVNTAITSKGYITEADISSEEATITIAPSSWVSGVYTYSNNKITATSNQEWLMPIADGTNATMLETIRAAMIEDAGQSAGKALLRATGTVPTTQIQLRVIFRGEK